MIEGKQIIGYQLVANGAEKFQSKNPAAGSNLSFQFTKATDEEINRAVTFRVYRKKSGEEKARFLDAIGEEIRALGNQMIDVCSEETALPKPRLEGERERTINQLKMFSSVLREGSWVDARIDTADPNRTPLPKPDIRYMQIALGPVVVFGASNFPLAFSVAGGDTASALAAGCPVIVKAHEAHPATSELVARAIVKAAKRSNMPEGVFSMLFGDGPVLGMKLVQHAEVKAVGFTGSFRAGKAIFDAAMKRPVPIPVYSEMGSTNPVFILPHAITERGEKIAEGYAASVTLGVGQFCTNPGVLVHQKGETSETFVKHVADKFSKTSGSSMLAENIFKGYQQGIQRNEKLKGVDVLARGTQAETMHSPQPVLFKTTMKSFLDNHELSEEVFGPSSVVVEAESKEELLKMASQLVGHLTATVHGTDQDLLDYQELIEILAQKVGRVVINAFPTGVEVCHSMVHGGPFPATTDSRSTSVGSAAIYRFTRPVCYQNLPQQLLPEELRNENKAGIIRLVNGVRTKDPIQ
jgi:2,5-dioxopentanoate dehydrogenase